MRKARTKERYFMRREQTSRECWGGVSFDRESGGGGGAGGEMRLSTSHTLQFVQACWRAERVGTVFI